MPTTKRNVDDLALFGGRPLFSTPRPIAQLAAPPVEDFIERIGQSITSRRLTNGGPWVQELETRLAEFHDTKHCVAVANAGLGLMMLLQTVSQGRPGTVILPAFTFRGLPHFVRWAGLRPRFVDVDPDTHTLSPGRVLEAIDGETRAILGVCNFNSPGDIGGLVSIAHDHALPIVFDSVYAAGCRAFGAPMGGNGDAEVFSLHASKLINGFEGGYVTTNRDDLAGVLRVQRNFGYGHEDFAALPPLLGINAKLNEFHAAMALLSLDRLQSTISENRARFRLYREVLAPLPGIRLVEPDRAFEDVCAHALIVAETLPTWPLDRDQTVGLLRAEGALIGPYYSPALHLEAEAPPSLPVTEGLSARFLQLPGGALVSDQDVRDLGGLLRFVADHGREIATRLSANARP